MSEKLLIRNEGRNTYKVKYSKFDGDVTVRRSSDSSSEVIFRSNSKTPVSAYDLREFPLKAVEILIDNGTTSPAKTRPTLNPPKTRIDEEFLTQIRDFYLDALARNERPLVAISEHLNASRHTVARWVGRAREEGYLK